MVALRLPKETPEQQIKRLAAIEAATLTATRVPLRTAGQVVEVLALARQVAEQGNLNAISDAGTGAELALAALRGTALNVRINLVSLKDRQMTGTLEQELIVIEGHAEALIEEIHAIIRQRGGL